MMISAAQQSLTSAQLAPAQIGQAISTAVAGKAMSVDKMEGAAVLQLLDSAAQAGQSTAGDPLVAKATGLGGLLDVTG